MDDVTEKSSWTERLDYATETHVMSLSNFDNIWPWRWIKWYRVYKEVRRRIVVSRRARGVV